MEQNKNTRTWTNIDGQTEEVEIGSERDIELMKTVNDAGLVTEGQPGFENGITIDEYRKSIGLKPLKDETR
jgi:hypothetical protein